MCWTGNLILHTAEENIPIFKVANKGLDGIYSYYLLSYYQLGVLKSSPIIIAKKNWILRTVKVNTALHSYNPKKVTVNKDIFSNCIFIYYKGKILLDVLSFNKTSVVVKGFIPKGSQYCENEEGEIISDQLILTEICEIESRKL